MSLLFHNLQINAFITGPTEGTTRCHFWNIDSRAKVSSAWGEELDFWLVKKA